ncbi:MAG: hypothetical protein WD824_06275 [Cyclobacteriaceae bacterium]
MPSVTNKAYDSLLKVLDHLTMGSQKHRGNPRIAANLNPSELEVLKTELELLRQDYLRQEAEARSAYERFNAKFNFAKKRVSNDCRIIKGILDPRAEELRDYGIVPERSKAPKKILIERLNSVNSV